MRTLESKSPAKDPGVKGPGSGREGALGPGASTLVQVPALSGASFGVQRAPAPGSPPAPSAPAAVASKAAPERRILDDGAAAQPDQMAKSAFLGALRASVDAAVQRELKGTVWAVAGCPWIDHWFGYYSGQDAAHVEEALHAYAPGTRGAKTAADCIPIATERVRRGVQAWARPAEATPGADAGAMPSPSGDPSQERGLATVVKGEEPTEVGGGQLFFKRDVGSAGAVDPGHIASQLGRGSALDGAARARMERAFGHDFGAVRVHTDAPSATMASGLGAKAFTLGRDIAFARGEYTPGTLRGDALLAHELAHVVQQRGGGPMRAAEPRPVDEPESGLEHQADRAAAAAVRALWSPDAVKDPGVQRLLPGAAGGLRLQRCKSSSDGQDAGVTDAGPVPGDASSTAAPDAGPKKTPSCPTTDGLHFFPGQQILVFIQKKKEMARFSAQGGPAQRKEDPGAKWRDPTKEGEYRLLKREAHASETWDWSQIAWGTALQDQPKLNDVYYRSGDAWASLKKDYGITRAQILDENYKLYKSRAVPGTWVFNAFGKQAFLYYRDVNKNKQYDEGVDEVMQDMIHTTPESEAEHAQGKPESTGESHGCIHIKPADRDTMKKKGMLVPGTVFIVHGYGEEYKCP